MDNDYCLPSQGIRQLILNKSLITSYKDLSLVEEGNRKGQFQDESLEKKVQPSSFDASLSQELFILDSGKTGIFRTQTNEYVWRALLQIPRRQRQNIDISSGFELKKGYTALIKLEEQVSLHGLDLNKSSPKSSFGRLFLNTRLLADYNPCFDEINSHYQPTKMLDLWLLVQSLAFDVILYPKLPLNQLRFYHGDGGQLSTAQIKQEWLQNPMLYEESEPGKYQPIQPILGANGLRLNLNLSGKHSEGIVALKSRANTNPIDLQSKQKYDAEDYFDPIISKNGKIRIDREGHYLAFSANHLVIPVHLGAELKQSSHTGIMGALHFAGYGDNGFRGDLVFEIAPDEREDMELTSEVPISELLFFRTHPVPDKVYGEAIGSNYQDQLGPKIPKFLKPFDYAFAAKNYEKLNRDVLVQDNKVLRKYHTTADKFQFLNSNQASALFNDINNGFFLSRYDCESDELVLQPIPYVLFFGQNENIFSYVRSQNIKDYGDRRLFGKHSIGLGGHINREDHPAYIKQCMQREAFNEEVTIVSDYTPPVFIGTILANDTAVDRVHFGLVYAVKVLQPITPKEASIVSGKMIPIAELMNDPLLGDKYETWSRVLAPHLPELYDRVNS